MYVIKYDDDWERFKEYLKGKRQQFVPQPQPTAQQASGQQQVSAQHAASPPQADYKAQILGDVYTFKAPFSEDVYTAIARMVVPGRSPEELGKFKVVQIDGERVVVSKEPLTIEEYQHLYNSTRSDFEAYIEDKVPMVVPDDVEELIRVADSVKAYSERYVAVASRSGNMEEEIHIELPEPLTSQPKLVEASVKAYAKAEKVEEDAVRIPQVLLSRLRDMQKKMCTKRLKLRAGVADAVADLVSICMSRGAAPDIRIEGAPTSRDVEEVEKALVARGFKVEKGDCGGIHSEIIVEKGYGGEILIRCW